LVSEHQNGRLDSQLVDNPAFWLILIKWQWTIV